jgi:hypothetical protein
MHHLPGVFQMVNDRIVDQQQDIKRILIERDITTLKQVFCRIMCAEIHNNSTRIFVSHRLFSRDRLQSYLFDKELGFSRQMLESEDLNVYNQLLELVINQLVSDGTIIKQQEQKESTMPNDSEERYEATQKLDTVCKDFRDSGLSF